MATKRTSTLLIALCVLWLVPLVGGCSTVHDGIWTGPSTAKELPTMRQHDLPSVNDPKRADDLKKARERSPSYWRQKLRAKYA